MSNFTRDYSVHPSVTSEEVFDLIMNELSCLESYLKKRKELSKNKDFHAGALCAVYQLRMNISKGLFS